jgi:uncharacterized iron-regulated protein
MILLFAALLPLFQLPPPAAWSAQKGLTHPPSPLRGYGEAGLWVRASALTSSYTPERVYDTRARAFTDFELMLADAARADVVFIGEQHDDPNTHALELAVLEGLTRRNVPLILSLEMFERDVQETIDRYLAGTIDEEEFLKTSRPWPRYATDYRPLVEFARAQRMRVVAANVPRRLAADVSRGGLDALQALGSDRALAARDLQCPTEGEYYTRFVAQMSGHPMPGDEQATPEQTRARNDRFYLAQCVKDETMAESLATAFDAESGAPRTIVHVTGAFHSDFAEGTAARTRRRLPDRRIVVISVLPVPSADIDTVRPTDADMKRADFLIYTVAPPTNER